MSHDLPLFVHSAIDDMDDLTPNALRVYMHLARRADADNVAWPSYQAIGDHCFKSISDNPATRKSHARNAIAELIEAGLLSKHAREREDGGQSSNGYALSTIDSLLPPVLIKHPPVRDVAPPMLNGHAPCLSGTKDTLIEGTPIQPNDANASAQNAPSPSPANMALTFRNFRDELLHESANRTAVLMRAYLFCYGKEDAPDFGRLGMFAKRVGGAGMALELIWSCTSRPPNGSVLDYLEVMFKARQSNRNGASNGNHTNGNSKSYEQPARADFTAAEWREFLNDPEREPSPF